MSLVLELIEAIGLSGGEIQRIIDTAPARYRVYPIQKRNGGYRIIAQPSRELKAIQRFVMDEKLQVFRVHPSAMAYTSGRGIYDNAISHRRSRAVLKLDFKDFFPSIKVKDWEYIATRDGTESIIQSEIKLYSKILFWSQVKRSIVPRCLSIGAPTSPLLSNIIMYDFDAMLTGMANDFSVSYTRYADDITVSGNNIADILDFERKIRRYVRTLRSPKLDFNEDKRGLYKVGQKIMVTGLVVTPQKTISLGRARKRKISSMLHRSSLGQLETKDRSLLKGLLGFCASCEPVFLDRLRSKYGDGALNEAMRFHAPKRETQLPMIFSDNHDDKQLF